MDTLQGYSGSSDSEDESGGKGTIESQDSQSSESNGPTLASKRLRSNPLPSVATLLATTKVPDYVKRKRTTVEAKSFRIDSSERSSDITESDRIIFTPINPDEIHGSRAEEFLANYQFEEERKAEETKSNEVEVEVRKPKYPRLLEKELEY